MALEREAVEHALDEIRQIALNSRLEMSARATALKTYVDARPADLRSVCESLPIDRETRNW